MTIPKNINTDMSSPELERFEITDEDYEFGFNRRRGNWSKNHATYGVFLADIESDEERSGLGRDKKGPIGFISGGLKDESTKKSTASEDESAFEVNQELKPRNKKINNSIRDGPGFGSWEKHTKGIGWALISKMGFKHGQGLGKNEQGIKAPVEVFQRKGKGALGYYGSERPENEKNKTKENQINSETKEKKKNWKKDSVKERTARKKYDYKTIDEAIADDSQKPLTKPDIKVKVIDMTGKEHRVLSGYGALAHKVHQEEVHTKSRGFDLPELRNNLSVLCDSIEEEIVSSNRKKRSSSDLMSNLEHEHEKMQKLCEREEKFIETLKNIQHILDSTIKRSRDCLDPFTIEDCARTAEKLKNEYPEEYFANDLDIFILSLVLPLFKKILINWQPLNDQFQDVIPIYKTWRNIFLQQMITSENYMNPYERLIWETWIPVVRSAITSHWNGRDVCALVFVDSWQRFLPDWIFTTVLDHLILPKLETEVNEWDPLSDNIPIHDWLLKWSSIMGDKLNPLYESMRYKFSNALQAWHPSDPSAKFMLQPWNSIFQRGHMHAFLIRNVAPKLGQYLSDVDLSPNRLKLNVFEPVMTWKDLIPIETLISLFERHFFSRWLQTLCHWLNQHPNYDEVSRWYMGWKQVFQENGLLEKSYIRDQLNSALDLMNRAVNGERVYPNLSFSTDNQKQSIKTPQTKFSSTGPSLSYKDVIEKTAKEKDIIFRPLCNRTYESKQIYQFGRMDIYFDRNVLFVNEGSVWVPTSLNNLIDKAR